MIVLTLAIGIGANTAVFTFLLEEHWTKINAPDVERLFFVRTGDQGGPAGNSSYQDAVRYREALEGLGEVSPWAFFGASIQPPGSVDGHSVYGVGSAVSPPHFRLFGVHEGQGRRAFTLGRDFRADEFTGGGARVVIVDYTYWRRHLGADSDIVGKTLKIRGYPYSVVGVAPRGFENTGQPHTIYVPIARVDELSRSKRLENRQIRNTTTLFRIAADAPIEATLKQSLARLTGVGRSLDADDPRDEPRQFLLENVEKAWSALDPADLMLAGSVVLLLLLACANVANLMLARAAVRRREIAVQTALGARRGILARRLLTESALLAAAGGTLGLGLNRIITGMMAPFYQAKPIGFRVFFEGNEWRQIDARVLAFTAGISLLTAGLAGLAPILQAMRSDLATALKANATDRRPGRRLGGREWLVITQVGLSTILVLTTTLLGRSVLELRQRDLGFATDHQLILALASSARADDKAELKDAHRRAYEAGRQAILAQGGVVAATFADGGPQARTALEIPGRIDEELRVGYMTVGPDFFETYGLSPLQGRAFDERDHVLGKHRSRTGTVIVNRAFSERFFDGREAIGRELHFPALDGDVLEDRFIVVGVAPNFGFGMQVEVPPPMVYLPLSQCFTGRPMMLTTVRVDGPPAGRIVDLRRAAEDAHPDVAVIDAGTQDRQVDFAFMAEQLNATIVALFSAFGLFLACLGIYSAMTCAVSNRQREMGIRLAVGATVNDVVRLVLGETSRLVMGGIAVGIAGALVAERLMQSLLHGIALRDPRTFILLPLLLIAVAVAAAWWPARCAGRVDPHIALRDE